MNSCALERRSYRILGVLALLHAAALVGLYEFVYTDDAYSQSLARVWVVATALWLVWPLILLLRRGRSVRLFTTIAVPAALIYTPSFYLCQLEAPGAFGLEFRMTPSSAWHYWTAYRKGRADAEQDLRAGKLAIEVYGFGAGAGSYVALFRERFQAEVYAVAGCLVNDTIIGHAAGYNAVNEAEIERRFGKGAVEAAHEQGAKLDRERNARERGPQNGLARRVSSLAPEAHVVLHSLSVYPAEALSDGRVEQEQLSRLVHAIEAHVSAIVPLEAEAFELLFLGTLTPDRPPTVTTSSNGGLPQAIRDRVDKSVKNLPDARARAEVSYQLSFVNADRAHESTPIASAN
jgi:hypothetical protein